MPSAVRIEAVRKTYGATVALDNVSLDIEEGQMVALLGPSGCGKTTLLRAIAGLDGIDSGVIRIGDRDVTSTPARQRPIGMVFQHYALFPNMTVAQNISFPLDIRRQRRAARSARVAELLELTGMTDLAGRYPNELSGGQQQRVALARALAPEPDVLLLDEPLAALDATIRNGLRDEIRRIQHRIGITAVFVTHDQSEAMAVADRVAVMDGGRILEAAPPAEIYDRPVSRFAATFVGSRNAIELPIDPDRMVRWGEAFAVPAPQGGNGKALAVFRPEDVRITEHGGMAAAVDVVVFLGAISRVYVTVDGHTLHVDLPSPEAAAFSHGQRVGVAVAPDAVRVFAA
ncbi:ABC transporter ATP-binding protein [Mycolicibacterium doricum]|uniref:ABC-type quaternary amine transporter n=1 Tax=Mycolicibacterium doricum TaxID=126673 RepID=A0A1X1T349_9MYCO|nr:ABC transporter ATP-binding protein [Mycolicibacterium doricum]MCV7268684.1 ABC transporter ATP-binding protein [Mycolicibacterium doricum]ORV38685.1 spermidine/putrescine ABC transporter ATP-binding protein [Mycolicibacterium doricum]BBZ06929.1 ABC transporter ATP-binding protein [Mycolicibacterium doricum]